MINTVILNAEDDGTLRLAIKLLLETSNEDYSIEEAKNGTEFNRRLDNKDIPIDIAILDIHMADYNIIKAVDRLWEEWKQTYIIVTSSDDGLDVILELQNKYHIWGYALKGTNYFGEVLTKLVFDAHQKVQNKNDYINKQIALNLTLNDRACSE